MSTLSLTRTDDFKADALVVGVRPGKTPTVIGLQGAAKTKLEKALVALGATGKAGEIHRLPGSAAGIAPTVVVAAGIGEEPSGLREAAGGALRALAGSKKVVVSLAVKDEATLMAVAESAALGAYQFVEFKSKAPAKGEVKAIAIAVDEPRKQSMRDALTVSQVLVDATMQARDLINTPASHLHPADLADAALEIVAGLPIKTEVLDEDALVAGGYGGIVGVGQGAADGPRLVRLAYRPKGAKLHIALVGKGITFDTGGYWLKPTTAMLGMQADMSGAAAVITAMAAIAELEIPVNVTAYAACAENMVSGTAQRPTDVITMYGGKTVEVVNTDAEGRLVMADALVRTGEDKPDIVIDVATLTGAMVMSLGHRTAGFFSTDDTLAQVVTSAGADSGEVFWRMPFLEHMKSSLDSNIADIANVSASDRMGGAIAAALFLKEFVPANVRWAHLDIAGPAFNDGAPYGPIPKGGVGFAVRTLVRLAAQGADGRL